MSRWLLALTALAACGDNNFLGSTDAGPDARITTDADPLDPPVTVDAALEPDAPTPPTCDADTTTDEANCGTCGTTCAGGELCTSSACACPASVTLPIVFPTGTEQFFGFGGFRLALAPTLGAGGINGLVFGFNTSLPLNTNINLATVPFGSMPIVGAAVGLDLTNFSIDASYVATAGTIRFTKICETEIQGTLIGATFSGLSGGLLGGLPMVDPEGCQVQAPFVSFHLRSAPCAP